MNSAATIRWREEIDVSQFSDPEIFYRVKQDHHIGFVLRRRLPSESRRCWTTTWREIARDRRPSPPADRAFA